jgi:hypothetical protein
MSASGQKRTCSVQIGMSALGNNGHSMADASVRRPRPFDSSINFALGNSKCLGLKLIVEEHFQQMTRSQRCFGPITDILSIYPPIPGKSFRIMSRATLQPLSFMSSRALTICSSIRSENFPFGRKSSILNPFRPTNFCNSLVSILNEQSIPRATKCETRTINSASAPGG